MPVGFQLRPFSTSRAYNLVTPHQAMDLTAHPFDVPAGTPQYHEAYERRYGVAKQITDPADGGFGHWVGADFMGLHQTDYESALITIATKNPGWFAANRLGSCVGIQPTKEESADAQAADGIHQEVLSEAARLDAGDGGRGGDGGHGGSGPSPQLPTAIPDDVVKAVVILQGLKVDTPLKAGRLAAIRTVTRFLEKVDKVVLK